MRRYSDGDRVVFTMDGQESVGQVEHVMDYGTFGLPGSRFYYAATAEDPAVLLRIIRDGKETELMVGRKSSEVRPVDQPEPSIEEYQTMSQVALTARVDPLTKWVCS
jgi:hypothetical protein